MMQKKNENFSKFDLNFYAYHIIKKIFKMIFLRKQPTKCQKKGRNFFIVNFFFD